MQDEPEGGCGFSREMSLKGLGAVRSTAFHLLERLQPGFGGGEVRRWRPPAQYGRTEHKSTRCQCASGCGCLGAHCRRRR